MNAVSVHLLTYFMWRGISIAADDTIGYWSGGLA